MTPVPLAASATAASRSSGVTIDVVSINPTHTTITPGQTATVPAGNGEIDFLVHYPSSLWTSDNGSSHPYPIKLTVKPSDWQATLGNWARNDVLTVHMFGSATGHHTVTIDVAGGNVKSVSFGLDIVSSATPTTAASARARTDRSG